MICNPTQSGLGKWKPVPNPEGITSTFVNSNNNNDVTYTFNGLTKENIKKGCLLCVIDQSSACILHVHENGKIEMSTKISGECPYGHREHILVGPSTISGASTGVLVKYFHAPVSSIIIGLD